MFEQRAATKRFWAAMGAYAVLAVLSWITLTERIPASGIELRWFMLTLLAVLAIATWARRERDQAQDEEGGTE